MEIVLKEEFGASVSATSDGYLAIIQNGCRIRLSASEVKRLLAWLEDGNGLSLEQGWNNGVARAEG